MSEKLKLAVMESMKDITSVDKTIEKIEKIEKQRANFLNKFGKDVIGWWDSKSVSVE